MNKERRPLVQNRHDAIVRILRKQRTVGVRTLAKDLKVSEATILADISILETSGVFIQKDGEAISIGKLQTAYFQPEERSKKRINEKRRIAEAAAKLVRPGEVILLDSGTTTVEMIPWLEDISGITIVTAR